MKIRLYRTEDWLEICAIYDLSKPDEMRGIVDSSEIPPLKDDTKMLSLFRESRIIVVENTSQILGFAGNVGNFISWLFVHPNFRQQGLAKELILRLLSEIEGPVFLNVARSNIAAIRLYRKIGFTTEREYDGNFHGNPCPAARLRHENSTHINH